MKIAMLISGGVDSAVALTLLKQAGHDVTAFYLKIWLEDEVAHLGDCAWETDLLFVEKTCAQLGVPLRVISMQREYWQKVVAKTIAEVAAGYTPNPDIWCNERVKFGAFYEKISDDFEKVATGHYARVLEKEGRFFLKQAPDAIKDQTYFLSRLSQKQLSRALFPIGHLKKSEVRRLAEDFNLPPKKRKDSQGICFLGMFHFSDFLRAHLGEKIGALFCRETGKKLGTHRGAWFYTNGQRGGLGLSGGPFYVVKKNMEKNIVWVSRKAPVQSGAKRISLRDCNWIPTIPQTGFFDIKLRHGPTFVRGELCFEKKEVVVQLEKADRGIASGQSLVFYRGGLCLGGGIIDLEK